MRRSFTVLALLAVMALTAVACGGTKDTGFPPPSPTTSGDEDGEGDAAADFSPTPQTGPSTTLDIKALSLQFNRDEVLFVADQPITLTFENLDANILHNVAIYPSEDETTEAAAIFQGETFTGEDSRVYQIPATPAGEYYFHCDVHPTMNGTVTFE